MRDSRSSTVLATICCRSPPWNLSLRLNASAFSLPAPRFQRACALAFCASPSCPRSISSSFSSPPMSSAASFISACFVKLSSARTAFSASAVFNSVALSSNVFVSSSWTLTSSVCCVSVTPNVERTCSNSLTRSASKATVFWWTASSRASCAAQARVSV
eukprot:scaffold32921_cov73-Phaeocystis_antarctica.AAC.4